MVADIDIVSRILIAQRLLGRIHACRRGEMTRIDGVVKHFSKTVRLRKPLSSNQLRHFLHVVSRELNVIDG